jgi:hypothetical protein
MEVLERQLHAIDSMANVRGRQHQTANVWIYHSPKNGKRFALEGNKRFFACILYEADVSVSWYSPETAEIAVTCGSETASIQYDVEVRYVDGRTEWVKFVSDSSSKRRSNKRISSGTLCTCITSRKDGVYLIVSEEEMAGRALEFDNWLLLCSAMTRTMYYSQHVEASVLAKAFVKIDKISLNALLQLDEVDAGLMLSVIAHGLRTGMLYCDISERLLTRTSEIFIYERASLSIKNLHSKLTPPVVSPPAYGNIATARSSGFDDPEKWPAPDASVLSQSEKDRYFKRKNAISMRLAGSDAATVTKKYGLSDREQRRLIERCKTSSTSGGIVGFYACMPGYRTAGYERTKPLTQRFLSDKGGCSGALEMLFRKHPLIQRRIVALYLKEEIKGHVHEVKISKRAIWKDFKKEVRALGYSDFDWPFNTSSQGYVSICSYLKSLHQTNYKAAASARYGVEAARRTAIGTGKVPLITARRPCSIMQLDYQLIDAASIIVIKNRYDVEIEVKVNRWYFGLMGDEHNALITGVFIGYESNPTSDCALKIIDSSLRPQVYDEDDPRIAYIVDGKILPNELIPALTHQCFSVLRVDNAWANAARNTVNTIIDVVGCALNFGAPRAWWARPIIERIIKGLTNKGLQRLPSSHGTGPGDPLKDNPAEKASVFRIEIEELTGIISKCVRKHNENLSSGRESSSPLQVMRAALTHDRSGFIPQLLPRMAVEDKRLLTYVQECKVYARPNQGIRPRVKWDECCYTSTILSMRDDLIGSTLILYSNLDDIRDVVATVKETGEDIGPLIPEARWRHRAVSVRFRKLINRHGAARRSASDVDDPLTDWGKEKSAELSEKASASKRAKRKLAVSAAEAVMLVTELERNALSEASPAPEELIDTTKRKAGNVFGEVDVSSLFTVVRTR